MGTKRLFQPNEVHKNIKSKKAQIVATTSTTQSTTTTTKMSYSNKHSGLCSSRTSKSKKTSSKYYQHSNNNKSNRKIRNYTIYAQNLFLDNCFISSLNGDFDIQKQNHQGDLYKTACKTTIKNLAFEKYSQNRIEKLKIMETDNPAICDPNVTAVYNLSIQNQEEQVQGKYQLWQKIANSSIILTNDVYSFGSLGGAFDSNCGKLDENSKINALTPDAFGCYANGGERYVGNLVLNNLGYDKNEKIQSIKSVSKSDKIYTTHKNEKLDLLEVKTWFYNSETCTGKEFCILTPRIMIKRSEMEKSKSAEIFSGAKNKACSNMMYSLKHSRIVGEKSQNNKIKTSSGIPENVNRNPETVVEPTRNDWKHEADKQKSRANKVFLSKIKKNKTLSKYQTTVCF